MCAGVLLAAYDRRRWIMYLDELYNLDEPGKKAALTVIEKRVW